MNTANGITRLVDELAAHWTEPALQILKGAGIRRISVEMELQLWRILKSVLRAELRMREVFGSPMLGSLSLLMEQTIREAALIIAEDFEPQLVSREFGRRVSQLANERRSTSTERDLYSAMVRWPIPKGAFKMQSQTDFAPRWHVLAQGG